MVVVGEIERSISSHFHEGPPKGIFKKTLIVKEGIDIKKEETK